MPPPPESADSRYTIPSLDRALTVLEHLAGLPDGETVSGIAQALDLPLNSVYRISETLLQRGYLEREAGSKRLFLGRKLLRLGYIAVDAESLTERALPVLRQIVERYGETALVGVLSHHQGVVLDQVPGTHPVKVTVAPGTRFPLHSAAPGKAMLAALPAAECEAIVAAMTYERFTARTIGSPTAMRAELAKVREQGYAVDCGEELEGLNCVGSVVLDHRRHPVAAVWITGPSDRVQTARLADIGRGIAELAAGLSRRMGCLD